MSGFKIKDFYFAGTLFGVMGGIAHNLLLLLLIKLGLNTRTFWKDMAEVLFDPPQVLHWSAQLLGLIASLALAGINGVVIALLLKLTGKDYIYVKSASVSSAMGFFVFIVIYPALGLNFLRHSITTNYVAFFTFLFYGSVVGYLMKKFTDFSKPKPLKKYTIKKMVNQPLLAKPARKAVTSKRTK